MAFTSSPELLALHGVRILGMAASGTVARRYGLGTDEIKDLLLDAEARGQVQRHAFAGVSGWGLTVRRRTPASAEGAVREEERSGELRTDPSAPQV